MIASQLLLKLRKKTRPFAHALEDAVRFWREQQRLPEIINQQELRVVGLRRAGNHAIIHWLCELYRAQNRTTTHLNDLLVNENPYRYKYKNLRDHHGEHRTMTEHYRKQAQGQLIHRDCLICSYEDYSLMQIAHQPRLAKYHDLYLGKCRDRADILILRDPFNWLASRLKSGYLESKTPRKTVMELWLEYAQEFLGETNYLRAAKVMINYNRWCTDEIYRYELTQQLHLPYQAVSTDKVSGCGNGSSFDGFTFQGRASQMQTQNRWQQYQNDPQYCQLINHPQVREYSEQIFGQLPGTEVLFRGLMATISKSFSFGHS